MSSKKDLDELLAGGFIQENEYQERLQALESSSANLVRTSPVSVDNLHR
jgi:hypothetical protein